MLARASLQCQKLLDFFGLPRGACRKSLRITWPSPVHMYLQALSTASPPSSRKCLSLRSPGHQPLPIYLVHLQGSLGLGLRRLASTSLQVLRKQRARHRRAAKTIFSAITRKHAFFQSVETLREEAHVSLLAVLDGRLGEEARSRQCSSLLTAVERLYIAAGKATFESAALLGGEGVALSCSDEGRACAANGTLCEGVALQAWLC